MQNHSTQKSKTTTSFSFQTPCSRALSTAVLTDHDWKAVAYAIGNVLQCWEHQGSLDAILEYDAYVDETTREVVDIMRTLRTTSKQLTEYTIEDGQSVAVIGYDQLTNLERSILPDEFNRIDLFTDEAFDYPEFHVFQSATDIVTALLDTITAHNAEHVAVVLDSGSQYSSFVESALEAAEIPFCGGLEFIEMEEETFIHSFFQYYA